MRLVRQLREETGERSRGGAAGRPPARLRRGVGAQVGATRPTSTTVSGRATTAEDDAKIRRLEQEVRELRRANEILQVGVGFLRGGARPPTKVIVDYIDGHRDEFGVEPICRVLLQAAIAPSHLLRGEVPAAVGAGAA